MRRAEGFAVGERLRRGGGSLANQVQPVILDAVEHRRHEERRIAAPEAVHLAQDEIDLIADLEHRRILVKMLFRALPFPPRALHNPADELILARSGVPISALRVALTRVAPDAPARMA